MKGRASVDVKSASSLRIYRGAGLLPGWENTALVTIGQPVEPDLSLTDRYASAYEIYTDSGAALTGISHRLARRNS